jgi:trehalose utilization protein
LPDEVLNNTDVLVWWGHVSHALVDDALVDRIRERVYAGKMGFIALHSAHFSKPFRRIVGTSGVLTWGRNQKEIVWNLMPSHPIAAGIPDHFCIESEELYAEPFYIDGVRKGDVVVENPRGLTLFLKPRAGRKGYMERKLREAEGNPRLQFCCINSLSEADPEEQEMFHAWAKERIFGK